MNTKRTKRLNKFKANNSEINLNIIGGHGFSILTTSVSKECVPLSFSDALVKASEENGIDLVRADLLVDNVAAYNQEFCKLNAEAFFLEAETIAYVAHNPTVYYVQHRAAKVS